MAGDRCKGWSRKTVDNFGRLDIAFNNAGITRPPTRIQEIEEDAWERVIAVDQSSIFLRMKCEIRQMLTQSAGVIVNTASTAPFDPAPYKGSLYCGQERGHRADPDSRSRGNPG
ncbi:SDR family NAD(P)-dependent oxidoreductase [Sphingobium sp. YR768]|uniref:SDR family NAD(P)-dependent oxidoreductase n=1 Tax=Sphingobium sp. YR768 TaxID=1884365 RepID=UPI000B89B385